jgi:hypothetical protein
MLQYADLASGIGRFAILLLGLADGQSLDTPLEKGSLSSRGVDGSLLYLNVFDEGNTAIKETEGDANSPRFTRPTVYTVKYEDGTTQDVHWTRVIHITEGFASSHYSYGTPRLQAVYNRMLDIEKIMAASGDAAWALVNKGIVLTNREGYELPTESGAAEARTEQISQYLNGLRRTLELEGIDATMEGGEIVDPTSIVRLNIALIAGCALASPFILFMWLMRRPFYVWGQPQWSATGGVLYLGLMSAGLYGLFAVQRLSAASSLLVMAGASLVVGFWLLTLLRPPSLLLESHPQPARLWRDHWSYGRWATATAVFTWLPSGMVYLLLPAWTGLEGSAVLRAMMNLIMPLLHAHVALSHLLIPLFATSYNENGYQHLSYWVRMALIALSVCAICYWVFLLLFREELFVWIYRGRYATHMDLLLLAGVLPLFTGVVSVFGSALLAMERQAQVFWCSMASCIVALTLGLWLTVTSSVTGAMLGQLASSFTNAMATGCFYLYDRSCPKKDVAAAPQRYSNA